MNSEELQKMRVILKLDPRKWEEANYGPYFKTFLLFLTNRCNLRCATCFNKNNISDGAEMSFKYVEKIVENNPLVTKYDIMGGEPLMHTEIDKILSYLERKNKQVGLYTNGILLDKLKTTYNNLRLNLSFHSIVSTKASLKPIKSISRQIEKYESIYPVKLCYLISRDNKKFLKPFAKYIEDNFRFIPKLTIGALRDEADYWNNECDNILPLEEYINLVQDFLDTYTGKLNLDIFTEGVVFTPKLPKSQPNQINRFKCIFVNNKHTECLYDVGTDRKIDFDPAVPIEFCDYEKCPRYDRENCLTDKIKLTRV